ncbi:polyprenyl synthetase family protein [Pseudomonas sp. RP23018S]|uniref:polyprenyl synthetase family protein n=1 Tax=Pseudomonas sp. RP23018S TaxID=3096037 RepID=UPI002ACA212A|nr:polyprenyl synthetase family protein [Pseudomonas sp. RP23018S]MDZ5605347.1 polyprenyl synthetase family protein [Pseudomonas sp. RP23018S]
MTTTATTPVSAECAMADALEPLREAFEARLDAVLPSPGNARDLVAAAMRECSLAPGKRLRPLLLVLTAEGLGASRAAAMDVACAVELVHAASLVLDDLPCMDNAELRRGRATLHLAFGEDVAVLTAIALLSHAFGLMAAIDGVRPEVRNHLVTTLSQAIGVQGLVKGQLQDLREGSGTRTVGEIAQTNQLKTGVLFTAIMDMACDLADAPVSTRTPLHRFAEELGQAFQLRDDLRDRDPSSGKDQGKDDGKSTLVALCGELKVRRRLQGHVAAAQGHLEQASLRDQTLGVLLERLFA